MGPRTPKTPKTAAQKKEVVINRPPISNSSLVVVPGDAIEGYQNRIEKGIDWVILESARRHHKARCLRENIPTVYFSTALENKIKNSYLCGFLDENSSLSLEEHWEITLPTIVFDQEKCANEEGKICFRNANYISDNLIALIKQAVKANSRSLLKKQFQKIHVLRVIDSKITNLDQGLLQFSHLVTLNLCGNYISVLDTNLLPPTLRILELQTNRVRDLESFVNLPKHLLYLGLSRNLLTNDSGLETLSRLPRHITVIDLSDNDIYQLEPVITPLCKLRSLQSLVLAGNPCAMCMAYARFVISRLPTLKYLDNRQILSSDRRDEPYEPHPDDLRSTYFFFTVLRVMSAPCPPKVDKGATATFHVELELPLLDSQRRMFLMFRRYESLTELFPAPEDDTSSFDEERDMLEYETLSIESSGNIFDHLEERNPREIRHYTTFESNKIPWSKFMNFQEPTVKIFCPVLTAVRDTFRTVVTVRLVYTLISSAKPPTVKQDKKADKKEKGPTAKLPPVEQRRTIASTRCALRPCDWSQPAQHFHWDETLGSDDALHWGDGDLSVLQYTQPGAKQTKQQQTSSKPQKSKTDSKGKTDEVTLPKQVVPENLTCHFSFGVDRIS